MKNTMTRILAFVLTVLMLFSLVACSKAPESTDAPTEAPAVVAPEKTDDVAKEEPAEKVYEPVTLTCYITGNAARAERYTKIFEQLKEEKNITVEVLLTTSAEIPTKYATEIAAGTAADFGWMMESSLDAFMASGNLVDISEIVNDEEYDFADIFPSVAEITTYDGKIYGVPFTAGARVLFFNKDLYAAAGLEDPLTLYNKGEWTWDKLFEQARALTDKSKGIYGLSMINYSQTSDWSILYDYVWAKGADFFSRDMTKALMNSPEMEACLQEYYDLMYVDGAAVKPSDQITFESGQVAIARNQLSFSANIQDTPFEWDIVPMPQEGAPSVTGTAAYVILKGCKHPEAALEAIKFITDKERQMELMDTFAPTRASVLNSSEYLDQSASKPTPAARKAACVDSMENLRPMPSSENFVEIKEIVRQLFDNMYSGSMTIAEMLAEMEKQVTPLMNK